MTKYCCSKFIDKVDLVREEGLNIRIIKFKPEELLDKAKRYRFFITPGYKSEDRNVPTLNISNCPFCGVNLFDFYQSDDFINETDTSFLYP
jgi:hypothetical protein